jgi:hypothetical protein
MMVDLSALLLALASVAVWFVAPASRPAARLQVRFAAILLVAPCVAAAATPWAAPTVTLIAFPIALAVLALASAAGFGRAVPPSLAAPLLAAVCLGALAAALTGVLVFALAPAALAAAAIATASLRQFDAARAAAVRGIIAALCFLAAASAFALEGVSAPMLLFCAVGLLGLTLALSRSDAGVEEEPRRDLRAAALAVRRRRQR